MKFDRKSIRFKMWMYFFLFSAFILVLLWLLQIVFFQNFYSGMKKNQIEHVADTIIAEYGQEHFEETIDQKAFSNSLLIYVTDMAGNIVYNSDEHGFGDRQDGDKPLADQYAGQRLLPRDYDYFLVKMFETQETRIFYTQQRGNLEGQTLIYGEKFNELYLYISTPLEPVDATMSILQSQLTAITFILILIGFVVAYFISKKITKPISGITKNALQLAEGNFEVSFFKGSYTEMDQLAETLEFTASELSKVEKLRRELIANVSHDLRTPLTMIKAYSEMVRDISGDNKLKRDQHLDIIIDETDRLSALVSDLLDLSALQAGNEDMQLSNVDLSESVKAILSRFDGISTCDGYMFDVHMEPDLYVFANKPRIDQVIYNLVGNAIQYCGEDKKITVNLKDLGDKVRFEVADNGDGIPSEDISYVWERYYRTEKHKRSALGNGLGLSIVKSILEAHGANFGVISEVNEGSTFWFELKK